MKIKLFKLLFLAAAVSLFQCTSTSEMEAVESADSTSEKQSKTKLRTIVTTDGEIDDVDSFIRMLLYANEFSIEGLIYSSSMWHYKGDGRGTTFVSEMAMTRDMYGERTDLRWPGTDWMQELIGAYEEVYPNLVLHDESFPTAEYLTGLIHVGNIDFEGAMENDTEGSDFIKSKLLDDDLSPLYLQVWGGTNTIARALKSIEEEYKDTDQWQEVYDRVTQKAVIYAILDQDATYRKYIAPNWPDVKIFYNANQFWCFAYPWKRAVPEPWHHYLQGEFMKEYIVEGHGPLLAKYYTYGDGQQQAGDPEHIHGIDLETFNERPLGQNWGPFDPYDFISEGDSPAYLHLVDVGLDNLENPEFGGWGGRLNPSDSLDNRWEDGPEASDFNPFRDTLDATFAQTRWVPAIQEDFAARADWCVLPYEEANHAPLVSVEEGTHRTVAAGETLVLTGMASDPDGNSLSYNWWRYSEVDSYEGGLDLPENEAAEISFTIPEDLGAGQTIHLILEVKDDAEHPMTRYARVILEGK